MFTELLSGQRYCIADRLVIQWVTLSFHTNQVLGRGSMSKENYFTEF